MWGATFALPGVLCGCYRPAPPLEDGDGRSTLEDGSQADGNRGKIHPYVRTRRLPSRVSTPVAPTSTPVPVVAVETPAVVVPKPRAPEDYFPAPGATPTVAPVGSPAPRMFNVAVLTKSVECVWCHMNIYGDVGGINFTGGASVSDVNIFGKVFGTASIPLGLKAGARDGFEENYSNNLLKIFPSSVDERGIPRFPNPTVAEVERKVSGRFRSKAIIVGPVINGPLYISPGTDFEIAGDVLVKGDLVIAGNFSGQGTIYAHNIFIPGDIIARRHPYPFSNVYSSALDQAKASIDRADDSLHFYAFGQITVGSVANGLEGIIANDRVSSGQNASPYTASQPMDVTQISQYNQAAPLECQDSRFIPYVKRVDAFLFAADYITWRACDGYELNGGFVSPIVVITSHTSDAQQNVTRYDYRFRVGSTGFLALQDFFNSGNSP